MDDATGKLMELRFVPSESAFDYSLAYVKRHGRPIAFYSDKHSIFRVHAEGATGRSHGMSQFGRALAQLNIDIICANSRDQGERASCAQARSRPRVGHAWSDEAREKDRIIEERRAAGLEPKPASAAAKWPRAGDDRLGAMTVYLQAKQDESKSRGKLLDDGRCPKKARSASAAARVRSRRVSCS